jgi:enamine deaminase RidA (YjgF/YER057c/UK114 family)
MSGQAALDPETEKAVYEDSIYEQAKYTYLNIIAVLEAANLSPKNLIKTIEYVTPPGLEDYRSTAGIRKELLFEPYPASTGIICHSLLRPEFLIEIDPFAKYF